MTPEHEKLKETITALREENKRLLGVLRYVVNEDNGSWDHRKLIGQMQIEQQALKGK